MLVLKCECVADVMETSDLTSSSSASVKGLFVRPVSPIKTNRSNEVKIGLHLQNFASLSSLVSLSLAKSIMLSSSHL